MTIEDISGTEHLHAAAFIQVMKSCHNLRYLVAKDNTLRLSEDLLALFPPPSMMFDTYPYRTVPTKSLTSLNLSGNIFACNWSVLRLAEKYENLRSLDISHCITVAGPSALVAQCMTIRPLLEITFGGNHVE